ncbi:MAG: hypothetical protein HQL52_07605 [Magnetococcales bacterium]|nr:hypothetical protein [Magnetococcales bacterium]
MPVDWGAGFDAGGDPESPAQMWPIFVILSACAGYFERLIFFGINFTSHGFPPSLGKTPQGRVCLIFSWNGYIFPDFSSLSEKKLPDFPMAAIHGNAPSWQKGAFFSERVQALFLKGVVVHIPFPSLPSFPPSA